MARWSYCTLNWFGDQYKYWVFFDEIDDHHREIEEWKEKYTQDLLCEMWGATVGNLFPSKLCQTLGQGFKRLK